MKKILLIFTFSLTLEYFYTQNNSIEGVYTEYKQTLLNGDDGSKYTFDQKPFAPALQMIFHPDKKIVVINNDGYESNQAYTVSENMLTTKLLVKKDNGQDTAYAYYTFELISDNLILKEYKKEFNEKHFLKVYYLKKGNDKSSFVKSNDPEEIYTITEEAASFPGGMEEFRKFVMKELEMPKNIKEKKFKEKVYLKLIIDEKGKIVNCDYLGYPRLEFAEKAMQLVRKFPDWVPAKQKGKNVASYFNLPLLFNQN
jgi:hypothetical protein